MKKIFLFLSLVSFPLLMHATAQEGDVIHINGTVWELLGKPAEKDSVLFNRLKGVLPKERSWTTANWGGYTAYWSIVKGSLCLDSIQYKLYNKDTKLSRKECVPTNSLIDIYKDYYDGTRIIATWINYPIRIARGRMIYSENMGFDMNFERECIINVKQGKVRGIKKHKNFVVNGLSFDRIRPIKPAERRELFPINMNNYPELKGVKRIDFKVEHARVDSLGNLVECVVSVDKIFNYANANEEITKKRLAKEMAEKMKAYRPWRVLYINGEFRSYGIEGYTIPYFIEP